MSRGIFTRSPEMRKNLSEIAVRNGCGKYKRTPETLKKLSNSAKEFYENKTLKQREIDKEKNRQAQLKRYKDPEELRKLSEAHKISYKRDTTIRDRIGQGVRLYNRDHPDVIKRYREVQRRMWVRLGYHEAHSGENHPFWRGGQQEGYGCGWWTTRKKILERDGYICQLCGIKECLCVHHIDYIKHNMKENNLITLCASCNMHANFDREYWTIYFRSKMDCSLVSTRE